MTRRRKQPAYFETDGVAPMFPAESMLVLGDNLETLPIWVRDESVDLVYLDPPFNSNQSYNAIFKHVDGTPAAAQIRAFTDTWQWNEAAAASYDELLSGGGSVARVMRAFWDMLDGSCNMLAYLSMMAPRLVELRRVLKPTGSIYLHCDPTASHYLKLLMDAIYGPDCFANEIVWHYRKWSGGKYTFQRNHDVILFYVRTPGSGHEFNQLFMDRAPSTLRRFGNARIVSGYDQTGKRVPSQMADEDSAGVRMDDVWDIGRVPPIKQLFPTQKPVPLLERIIEASSNPGDVVLDPFCGCGSAVVAAQSLGRRWIGIDVSRLATDVIEHRLNDQYPGLTWTLRVYPPTIEEAERLAESDRHAFQEWACFRIGATPGGKGADRGIDGTIDGYVNNERWRALVSVKSGQHVSTKELRDLLGTVQREKAQSGIFVTLAKPPKTFAREITEAGIGDLRIPRLQVITIDELFAGKRPSVPAPHGVAQFDASERTAEPKERRTRVARPGA